MFFRYALQQMPTLLVFAKIRQKKKSHISRSEVRNSFLKQKFIQERRFEKERFHTEDQAGLWKHKRCGGATGRPPLFNRRYPTSIKDARASEAHDTRPMYRVPQVPQKRSSHIFRSFRPLRSCAVGNAEDVRLRFYRQFRLCFTTTDFGGRKGIGLSPYPYAVGITSFA